MRIFEYKEDEVVVDIEKVTYQEGEFTITFKEDGTYQSKGEEEFESIWKYKDNKLVMDCDEATITHIDQNSLVFKVNNTTIEEGIKHEEIGIVEMKC